MPRTYICACQSSNCQYLMITLPCKFRCGGCEDTLRVQYTGNYPVLEEWGIYTFAILRIPVEMVESVECYPGG